MDKVPSKWMIIVGQAKAYILTAFLTVFLSVIRLIVLLPVHSTYEPDVRIFWIDRAITAILLMCSGFTLIMIQRNDLRKWLPQEGKYLRISILVLPVLLLAVRVMLSNMFIPPLTYRDWWEDYTAAVQAVDQQVWWLSLMGGFVAGLPVGLLFGIIQSAFLPWHRRLWWVLSGIGWGTITALILGITNLWNIFLYGVD